MQLGLRLIRSATRLRVQTFHVHGEQRYYQHRLYSASLQDPKEASMQRGSDTVLLAAAIILAAVTAALSSEPVRREMDNYLASSRVWENTALVMGSNMSEAPARASTPMDWRLVSSSD